MTTRTQAAAARAVVRTHAAIRDDIGELVTRRPLPGPALPYLDPFLFLNHHGPQIYPRDNSGLPFGPHPHRGFETVTFVVEGELAHRDSGGHESVITAGGVQWMTAGRGIVHEEVSPAPFKRDGGPLEILQLWINLPARLKMAEPRYVGVQRHSIPAIAAEDGRGEIRLVSGRHAGREGPVASLTDVFMATVTLEPGARVRFTNLERRTLFLYVVRGSLRSGDSEVPAFHLAEFDTHGSMIELEAAERAFAVFGHADPIREPVVARGPFVMNTESEIVDAVRDYRAGRFGASLA